MEFGHQAFDGGAHQGLQLPVRLPIHVQISAERVAHLSLGSGPPGVLAQDEGPALSAQLLPPSAMVECPVLRTAMPPSGPRSASGRRPSPPASTRVSGPGQNASARAVAASENTSPYASTMRRPETRSRNGLSWRRPLSAARAATSAWRGREPKP